MFLFRLFGSVGSGAKLCPVLPSDAIPVHGEIRDGEYHEGLIGGRAMKDRVHVMLRDF
jgi:hypothetical protein